MSVAWRGRARRELCNRLCRREGQPAPCTLGGITDLDVEQLRSVAPPWAVVPVAVHLPQLARLHGYGFVVDVLAVRRAALPALGQPALRGPLGGAALRGCITGEGQPGGDSQPPAALLLAAVACAACGEVCSACLNPDPNPNPNPNPDPNPNPNPKTNPNPNPKTKPNPKPDPKPDQVLGVPVQRLREEAAIGTLDLTGRSLGMLGIPLTLPRP